MHLPQARLLQQLETSKKGTKLVYKKGKHSRTISLSSALIAKHYFVITVLCAAANWLTPAANASTPYALLRT